MPSGDQPAGGVDLKHQVVAPVLCNTKKIKLLNTIKTKAFIGNPAPTCTSAKNIKENFPYTPAY
jgi:hypothetical protein